MALQVCKNCTTRYAPAAQCPQCGANEWLSEEEADVAKANQQGQSTIYVGEGEPVPDNVPEGVRLVGPGAPDVIDAQMEQDLQEEGEQPSAGSSSEASPSRTGNSDSTSSVSPSSPAPTTERPSSGGTASAGAPTTAGSTPATTSPTSTPVSDTK
jgi:hypothetical protein